ncbi:MAG TPA: CheR family methyltransferase [Gemmataceae bacterium]|jgi:chemotaxis protein methyltransferase WspC|nr:CheR family methyltransferase [Gemmataceae bacterium]
MSLETIIRQLEERTGISAEALGPTAIPRAVEARMRLLHLADTSAYAARLAGHPDEFQGLVDEVVVPETWFFRGGDLFSYLAAQVREAIRRRPMGQAFRVLSVPCCTGEEPYSLAMALLDAGIPAGAWTIEGVDLSPRLIECAGRGRYTEFAFRQTAPLLRQRYFRQVQGGWQIDEAVRSAVRFRRGNLVDPLFLAGEQPFELIFCRNLLIYLGASARRQALATLHRLLAREGLLCLGHADALDTTDTRFRRAGPDGYFLHRQAAAGPGDPASGTHQAAGAPVQEQRVSERQPAVPVPGTASVVGPPGPGSSPRPDPAPLTPDLLTQARAQADCGQLEEALESCWSYLARSGPSPVVYSLMGVLHQSRRAPDEAMRCFRKALYLQPDHLEALTHLMLLCQELGDLAQAALLRRRLERTEPGGES